MPKKSNFITDSEVPDGHFFDTFGNGVNRKISKSNLFAQIKKQAQTYYYDSEDDLKAADLEADPDSPIYVRVAPSWRLYRITSLAPVAPYDIALNNGTTATLDRLENLQFINVQDMKDAPYLKIGDFVEFIGYNTPGDGGGNKCEIGTGFGTADNGSVFDLSGSGLQARGLFLNGANIKHWGASPLNSDNTPAIQAAFNYGAANKRAITIPSGTFLVDQSGSTVEGLPYGLNLLTDLSVVGEDERNSIIQAAPGSNMVVVSSERPFSNISLDNFSVFGDSANNPTGSMNIWVSTGEKLNVGRLTSLDAAQFAMRFQQIDGMQFESLYADNLSTAIGADAIHFYDMSNVTGSTVFAKSLGDDAFTITATAQDVENITISNIIATSQVTGGAGGRGVLLNLSDNAEAAGNQFTFRNVSLDNVVTYDCNGIGCFLAWAEFDSVRVTVTDSGSGGSFRLDGQTSNVTGRYRNCTFDVTSRDSAGDVVNMLNVGSGEGVTSDNRLIVNAENPADGFPGVTVDGDGWDCEINIDYDPTGTKVSPSNGVDIFATNSNFSVVSKNADNNVMVRATAANVTISPARLSGAVTRGINVVSGATNIQFNGGSVNGDVVLDAGTNTKFYGVEGTYNRGSDTISPDGSGQATIAHGLVTTPNWHQVDLNGAAQVIPNVFTQDATNLTIQFRDFAGAPVTVGSYVIKWEAAIR